jgi:hypothetical protein
MSRVSHRRSVAVLLLAMLCGGCVSWQATTASPRQAVEDDPLTPVRLTRTNGATVVLDDPKIRGDSLKSETSGRDSLSVAYSDITQIEVRRLHWVRGFLLFLLVGGPVSLCIDYC